MSGAAKDMLVVGLTGSIGMGKSTAANLFREEGVPVFDADATVHALYKDSAVPLIAKRFPVAVKGGTIDRATLAQLVIGRPEALADLEAIIHPLVRSAERAFIRSEQAAGTRLVVLDIPLLFETGGNELCDKIVVVTAPADVQRKRVLERDGMSADKFDDLLARQMSDADKRSRADFIIVTDKGLDDARQQVRKILQQLIP